MADPIAAIPTSHYGTVTTVSNQADVMAYLIRFLFANPGWTESYHETEMLSFRVMNAKCGDDPTALAEMISNGLQRAMSRYFPNAIPVVNVIVTSINPDGTYALSIEATDSTGVPLIPINKFKVNKDGEIVATLEG